MKKPTSIALTAEQRAKLEGERERLKSDTGIEPSLGDVVRAAIDRGLAAASPSRKPSGGRAA